MGEVYNKLNKGESMNNKFDKGEGMTQLSTKPTPEELKKESSEAKEIRKFVEKMDKGETKIKYNEDLTEADLVYKNYRGEGVAFPLEWTDRDCLEIVSEQIEGAVELIRKTFKEGNIHVNPKNLDQWALSMGSLDGAKDTMKTHLSKYDLAIIREPALSKHKKYLKNTGQEDKA